MKIKFKKTEDQIALVKAMASDDKNVALEAQTAFAAFIGPVVLAVIKQASTWDMLFNTIEFSEDEDPSWPLDLYYGQNAGYVTTFQQEIGGMLATNHVASSQELKLNTYQLDSAISFGKKNVRRARLDVIAKGIEWMAQEILVKQERHAWSTILQVLASASTKVNGTAKNHAFRATTADVFSLNDLSQLLTLGKRISMSFAAGSPAGSSAFGVTDLFVSPEIKEQVRGFVFNPMNTRQATSGVSSIPLDDVTRREIFQAAGSSELFGITLHELPELGLGQKYNTLFDVVCGTKTFYQADGTSGGGQMGVTDEILVGVDLTKEALLRPVSLEGESGSEVTVLPDDQFLARSKKIGYFSSVQNGWVCLDNKALSGLIV